MHRRLVDMLIDNVDANLFPFFGFRSFAYSYCHLFQFVSINGRYEFDQAVSHAQFAPMMSDIMTDASKDTRDWF